MDALRWFRSHYRKLSVNICTAIALLTIGLSAAKASEHIPIITIYTAQKVINSDPARPVARAIAVKDGRILFIGSLPEMQEWLKPGSYSINNDFHDYVISSHSLKVGASANFTVYRYDPGTTNPEAVKNIPIIAKVVHGEVYRVRARPR